MNARTTLAVFLAFAALAVFAWTLRDQAPRQVGPNAPTATPGPIWEVADEGVTALTVVSTTGTYTLTRMGDGWQVDGQPAASDVGTTVQAVAKPSVLRVLGEDRDPNDYGFAAPALTLTFTISDVQRVLLVGDQPPTTSDYYVRPAEGGPIRIVSGFDIGRLKEWLTARPYAPTATPEPTATPGEGTAEATAEGGEGVGGTPEGTPDPLATAEGSPETTLPATAEASATAAASATRAPTGSAASATPPAVATATSTATAVATPGEG